LGNAKDFCLNFLQTCPKRFCALFPTTVSHKDREHFFLSWPPKKSLHLFFCKRWAPFFAVKQRWVPFLLGFSEILPRYLEILPVFFQGFCPYYQGFCPAQIFRDFSRIFNKSKRLGCACNPASYAKINLINTITIFQHILTAVLKVVSLNLPLTFLYFLNVGISMKMLWIGPCLAVMESRDLVSVSRLVSRPVFWSLGLEGLVSVSKDFGLGLELFVSRLCTGYFLWSFARRSSLMKRFKKMIVQNIAVQRRQWLSFLCCYVVCEMEKTIWPLPSLKFILNSIKNVHVPKKPQRVISATRGWEYFAVDYLWTVFPRV